MGGQNTTVKNRKEKKNMSIGNIRRYEKNKIKEEIEMLSVINI